LIKWKDFPTEDNFWEPASVIHEDVPQMVENFHSDHPNAIRTILPSTPAIIEVSSLDDTECDVQGFGSSGIQFARRDVSP
jgi:Chromo (CHRromatin Organisation MOdifier) domain